MTRPDPLVSATGAGLACADGGFWIDPWRPVERAVVTHAHADHARPGSHAYLTSPTGLHVLRGRLGDEARIEVLEWGERRRIGDVDVSLPACDSRSFDLVGISDRVEHIDWVSFSVERVGEKAHVTSVVVPRSVALRRAEQLRRGGQQQRRAGAALTFQETRLNADVRGC